MAQLIRVADDVKSFDLVAGKVYIDHQEYLACLESQQDAWFTVHRRDFGSIRPRGKTLGAQDEAGAVFPSVNRLQGSEDLAAAISPA